MDDSWRMTCISTVHCKAWEKKSVNYFKSVHCFIHSWRGIWLDTQLLVRLSLLVLGPPLLLLFLLFYYNPSICHFHHFVSFSLLKISTSLSKDTFHHDQFLFTSFIVIIILTASKCPHPYLLSFYILKNLHSMLANNTWLPSSITIGTLSTPKHNFTIH